MNDDDIEIPTLNKEEQLIGQLKGRTTRRSNSQELNIYLTNDRLFIYSSKVLRMILGLEHFSNAFCQAENQYHKWVVYINLRKESRFYAKYPQICFIPEISKKGKRSNLKAGIFSLMAGVPVGGFVYQSELAKVFTNKLNDAIRDKLIKELMKKNTVQGWECEYCKMFNSVDIEKCNLCGSPRRIMTRP